jgi:phage shock protein PspC (stress-responsive transcriptional regulator)
MKKTFTVNLGRTVFSIDEDAYELLRLYLDKIESYFAGNADKVDIMNDIEARIAELLNREGHSLTRSVTLVEIEEVIRVMGKPEEFADSPDDKSGSPNQGNRTRRRIFRDVDRRILGGVCSGISAYLSIDVIWIRIIFVILALMAFSGVLVYILLWVVVPPAVTTAQKLEMRGEPVNINNIGRAVRDEFNDIRRNLKI